MKAIDSDRHLEQLKTFWKNQFQKHKTLKQLTSS